MPAADIVVKGAREHNLRDVHLTIPRNQLICFTGVSGSGKSSFAFDTLYAEGQRRYIESLSTYARQFLGQMAKPEVDYIGGLSPSISISQKSAGNNPRSTVGTITEIYDFLRVLYARVGEGRCPECSRPITAQSREQIISHMSQLPADTRAMILAPLIRGQKGEYRDLMQDLRRQGFSRVRVNGVVASVDDDLKLDRRMRHWIEVVVDRLVLRGNTRSRLAEAVDLALKLGKGSLLVQLVDTSPATPRPDQSEPADSSGPDPAPTRDLVFSANYACTHCGISFEPPSPQLFSFNSPHGMCLECDGLGTRYSFVDELLVTNPDLSFRDGCFDLIGPLKLLGRWKRHIYLGVAESVERVRDLPPGTLLDTPWKDLAPELRKIWLRGTGDQHITFTWRSGDSPIKYGGTFHGLLTEFMLRYRNARGRALLNQLEPYMRMTSCESCQGERLNPQARHVVLRSQAAEFAAAPERSLPQLCQMPIDQVSRFLEQLELDPVRRHIAAELLKEIRGRLGFLTNVGLEYLTLGRTAPTLSGGEAQRIRLAGQVGCGLVGVLYILDEPSIGLHPRDNQRLLDTLKRLRDAGNTVIVVEHDEETMRQSDHLIDFGPGAGVRGGYVVAQGGVRELVQASASQTGAFLSGRRAIPVPASRRPGNGRQLKIVGARHNNLKDLEVAFPLGTFVCITGVSGSGKSSLIGDILVEALRRDLNRGEGNPGHYERIEGLEHLDKMIAIDQSPIGRTPRSNPATYIKVFDDIRKFFTQLPEARRRGYKAGRFSFNVSGGRCPACEGNGSNRLEMDFLADVWVTCQVCQGHRFNRETLAITFKEKSIADVLEMDVQQALNLFENIPSIAHKLQTLHDVGLDYLKLGQPSPTLSGGEAQRIKLARELVKKSTGKTIYILDEPTTGLHFADIEMLLKVLHDFAQAGNTVVVVEHNLDVIKTADWIIDLGPEGGDGGGQIVAQGTPEQVMSVAGSHTGSALARHLAPTSHTTLGKARSGRKGSRPRGSSTDPLAPGQRTLSESIRVEGAHQHNLKFVSAEIPRDKMTVFCGPSGSGKSSLAMDTIYAEGQRRYVESLSAYARQFVGQMQKPLVEKLEGLSPAIAIEQQNLGNTPRSTVGTTTEIYDYLRVLFARLGTPHCPTCDIAIGTQSPDEIIEKVLRLPSGTKVFLLAPVELETTEDYARLWSDLKADGHLRVRVDGKVYSLDEPPEIDRKRKHRLEVIIDRVTIEPRSRSRIAESVEAALSLGRGVLQVAVVQENLPDTEWQVVTHSQHLACEQCGRSFETLTPHSFSFNSALGWCPDCLGLGEQTGVDPRILIRNPEQTLADGTLLLWPNLSNPLAQTMLQVFAQRMGIPMQVPYAQLSARHRRFLLRGTGEQWFEVPLSDSPSRSVGGTPQFRFQFKGLYSAIEDASRLSPGLRIRLSQMTDQVECTSCNGSRLRDDAAAVRFRDQTLDGLCRLPLGNLRDVIRAWKLTPRDRKIAGELIREIRSRVEFLCDVGLDYLTLGRNAATLSGGEAQRIRLASQLGSGLCGVLYVLDEPTIGLHPRDNARLIRALHNLRDMGNTLILVEHDREVLQQSDFLLDFGPRAGREGGEIVAKGDPQGLVKRRQSLTGAYLSHRKVIPIPRERRPVLPSPTASAKRVRSVVPESAANASLSVTPWLTVHNARHHNLKGIEVSFPLERFVAVTGPSGSGKSSLVQEILFPALASRLHGAASKPGAHDKITGIEYINKVICVDQQPLGNSPASNPATYTEVFTFIRELFANLPEAKLRGFTPRRFSFNVPGGRCETCEGNGQTKIEMHFLPDVWIPCTDCDGSRYNRETLEVRYRSHSIADVLNMTCAQALQLFENIPQICRILQTLVDVGLDYLMLGQPANTLSGGEAQRVKLAAELARPNTGRTLYLLDEPTTGLHFDDLRKLLDVLQRLVDLQNTVVVIEHNLDVIKSADWVVDMGPEAGEGGGYVVIAGTPEQLVAEAGRPRGSRPANAHRKRPRWRSYTAEALAPVLAQGVREERPTAKPYPPIRQASAKKTLLIRDVGAEVRMPWETDGPQWHCERRVGRNGEPCRWEGRILRELEQRIQRCGKFANTNWNSRTIVEIVPPEKRLGWFFHALTSETWLLKLKFRVARNTFRSQDLVQRLNLPTLNQLDELPVYGNEPRVKCKNLRGPWQEVELRVHSWKETNTAAFWEFLDQAIAGFFKVQDKAKVNPEEWMPWRKLKERWHLSRKGFPPGKKVQWEPELLEDLFALLRRVTPNGRIDWEQQQVVHFYLSEAREPWATVHTKRLADVELVLAVPKDSTTLGRLAQLGFDRDLNTVHPTRDVVKLKFRKRSDLTRGDLRSFLQDLSRKRETFAAASK